MKKDEGGSAIVWLLLGLLVIGYLFFFRPGSLKEVKSRAARIEEQIQLGRKVESQVRGVQKMAEKRYR